MGGMISVNTLGGGGNDQTVMKYCTTNGRMRGPTEQPDNTETLKHCSDATPESKTKNKFWAEDKSASMRWDKKSD